MAPGSAEFPRAGGAGPAVGVDRDRVVVVAGLPRRAVEVAEGLHVHPLGLLELLRGYGGSMTETWEQGAAGVLRLPSGRLVRGRGLRRPVPPGPSPTFGVYLLGKPPPEAAWPSRWIRWRDFWVPSDRHDARAALQEAWERAARERVEIACNGGRGRTGTALACLATLDGLPPDEAVAFVRRDYDRHAVETPWQKRFVIRFAAVSAAG